jgi:hypothetical protein
MRTKTLLATAAISAAFAITSYAQTVYSVNAVGYVNVTVPAGKFAILANPLNQGNNTLSEVFPDLAANTQIYLWGASGFGSAIRKTATGWLPPTAGTNVVRPGQGFFVNNVAGTDLTITFVGEVPQGDLVTSYPAGFALLSSQVPQGGKVETDLKLPAKNGDQVYVFTNGAYLPTARRTATAWVGGVPGAPEPVVGVGQGFWLNAASQGSWTRTFSVNSQ